MIFLDGYIKKVTDEISDKRLRKEIEEELACHIEEKAEFYVKTGYTAEAARKKAEEDMGKEPLTVANMLISIHPRSRRGRLAGDILLSIIFAVVLIFEIRYYWIIFFGAFEEISIIFTGICFSLLSLMLLYALKKKYVFMPFIVSLLSLTLLPFSVQLTFVTNFLEAVSGGLREYYINMETFYLYPADAAFFANLLFNVTVFIAGIITAVLAILYRRNRLGLRMLKIKHGVKVLLSALLVFTVVSSLLLIPGYWAKPDYKYEKICGYAIIPVASSEEGEFSLRNHAENTEYRENSQQECYYVFVEFDTFTEELVCHTYVGGEEKESKLLDTTGKGVTCVEVRNFFNPIDSFTKADIIGGELDISTQSGYLLVIPLIDAYNDEVSGQYYESRFSSEEAYLLDISADNPTTVRGNYYNLHYEIILR